MLTLVGRSSQGAISITSAHLALGLPQWERLRQLRALRSALPDSRGCTHVLGGDFNFPVEGEGRSRSPTRS